MDATDQITVKEKLLAKVSGKTGEHRVVFTSEDQMRLIKGFDVPDIDMERAIEFNPERKLESDEWFYIDLDDEHIADMIMPYIEAGASTADLNIVSSDDYTRIEVVYKIISPTVENEKSLIIFQKITNGSQIANKRFLCFSSHEPVLVQQRDSIEFTNRQDAFFDGHSRLFFKNFSSIRSFLPGIDDYYRLATDDEIISLKEAAPVSFLGEFKIGIRNRKRLAAIMNDGNIDLKSPSFQNKLRNYASRYSECGLVLGDDDKFKIQNDRELGAFLSLASGRYYTSETTDEKMEAKDATSLKKI